MPPPHLDLPRQQQVEHLQRSRPDHRRSHHHQRHISRLPPHSSARFNVNQTQPSSPVPPSSSTRSSTLTVLLMSLNPIPPIQDERSYCRMHLTSDWPPSQTQTVVLGLPTPQNIFAISFITIYLLPTIKRINSSGSS